MPPKVVEAGLQVVRRPADRFASFSSRLRWLELLWRGQAQRANALPAAGFESPVGREGWVALGHMTRLATVACAS